jgi:hypothetical protein
MTDQLLETAAQPADTHRAGRALGIAAVFLGVAALAAATFVLSYPAVHTFALQAGISTRLARFYPGLVDVMLVVILAAVLSLRGAGLPSRLLAWVALVLLLAAAAGASALHADGRRLPARAAEITAAVLPWLLVLVAFALLLAMLRHARLRRSGQRRPSPDDTYYMPAATTRAVERAVPQPLVLAGREHGDDRRASPPAGVRDAGLSIIPGLDQPFPAQDATAPGSDGAAGQPTSADAIDAGSQAAQIEPEPDWLVADSPAADDQPEPDAEADDMPVFHRVRSSPTPPTAGEPSHDAGNDTG